MKTMQIEVYMYDDEDRVILVEAEIVPADPGQLYGPAENCWPPEPAHIYGMTASWEDTGALLTDKEIDRWVDLNALYEAARGAQDDYLDRYDNYDKYADRDGTND